MFLSKHCHLPIKILEPSIMECLIPIIQPTAPIHLLPITHMFSNIFKAFINYFLPKQMYTIRNVFLSKHYHFTNKNLRDIFNGMSHPTAPIYHQPIIHIAYNQDKLSPSVPCSRKNHNKWK